MPKKAANDVEEYAGPTTNMKVPRDLADALKDMADEKDLFAYSLFDRLFRSQIMDDYAAFLERRNKRDVEMLKQLKKRP